jgi:hypothetical protein
MPGREALARRADCPDVLRRSSNDSSDWQSDRPPGARATCAARIGPRRTWPTEDCRTLEHVARLVSLRFWGTLVLEGVDEGGARCACEPVPGGLAAGRTLSLTKDRPKVVSKGRSSG